MSRRADTPAVTIGPWLDDNLGKLWRAPLTGQDWSALKASVEILGCYARCDQDAEQGLLLAFRGTVLAIQPGCRYLAFHSVAHVLDWHNRAEIFARAGLEIPQYLPRCKFGPQIASANVAVGPLGGNS